jgi:small-conductance mechanosensitive channel
MLFDANDLISSHRQVIENYMEANPEDVPIVILLLVVGTFLMFALYLLLAFLCMKISKKIFTRIEKKHGKQITFQFAEYIVKLLIIMVFILMPLAGEKIKESILGSAAVLAAVVGFAAQDVIKDILSGLLISIYKPFNLGDRIELEDGTAGIVESITMRHVVLILIDTVRLVVPNSKMNSATIRNLSYDYVPRSCEFNFPVHYNTDIEKAKAVIAQAVEASPYSIPGKRTKSGEMIYAPVYFIALDDSSLRMKVTVYFESGTPSEVLKDDIYSRVFEALSKAGIVIPYPHANIIVEGLTEKA